MTEIAIPYTQPELCKMRNDIISQIKIIKKEMDRLGKLTTKIDEHFDGEPIEHYYNDYNDSEKQMIKSIDKAFWSHLIKSMNIDRVMTEKAKNKLYDEMRENPVTFEDENINQVIEQSSKVYRESAFNTVKEVFDTLINATYSSNSNWRGKKNRSHKIEKLWRVRFYYHWNVWAEKYEHSYYDKTGGFQDIEKAFDILTGKKPKEYPHRWCDKFDEEVKKKSVGTMVECEYFAITFYKNENQKIIFKRLDLLEKLNKYGSNRTLFNEKKD